MASLLLVASKSISWPENRNYFLLQILRIWVLRESLDLKNYECTYLWTLREFLDLNVLPQYWHGKLRPSMWVSACSLAWLISLLIFPQGIHFLLYVPSTFSIIWLICLSSSSIFSKLAESMGIIFCDFTWLRTPSASETPASKFPPSWNPLRSSSNCLFSGMFSSF